MDHLIVVDERHPRIFYATTARYGRADLHAPGGDVLAAPVEHVGEAPAKAATRHRNIDAAREVASAALLRSVRSRLVDEVTPERASNTDERFTPATPASPSRKPSSFLTPRARGTPRFRERR
jgi:hypothetical protein